MFSCRFGTAKRLKQLMIYKESKFMLKSFMHFELFLHSKYILTFGSAKPTSLSFDSDLKCLLTHRQKQSNLKNTFKLCLDGTSRRTLWGVHTELVEVCVYFLSRGGMHTATLIQNSTMYSHVKYENENKEIK